MELLQTISLFFALLFTGITAVKYLIIFKYINTVKKFTKTASKMDHYGIITMALASLAWVTFYYLRNG